MAAMFPGRHEKCDWLRPAAQHDGRCAPCAIIRSPPASPAVSYLLISIVCSVLVSVLLKLMQRRGIDIAQGITWNYLAASLLCFALLDPPLAALSRAGAPHVELALLALLLPGIF